MAAPPLPGEQSVTTVGTPPARGAGGGVEILPH